MEERENRENRENREDREERSKKGKKESEGGGKAKKTKGSQKEMKGEEIPSNVWEFQNEWKKGDMASPLTEESSFATLFPKYKEAYLQENWPEITKALSEYGITAVLDVLEGTLTVKTTRKTWDPYAIIKARDVIKALSRSVPYEQALRLMNDDMHCDVIKIGNLVKNKERFVKRRQRLIGPDGATLKAIELLTNCYVLVQGKTVVAIGGWKDLKTVRSIVEDCMNNIHPIYSIKTLMIRRELAKKEELANEDWNRFLPKFKKKNVQTKKVKKVKKKKKEYNPFPPPQTPRQVDLQLESGEYFLSEQQRKLKEKKRKALSQQQTMAEKRAEKQKLYIPPTEKTNKKEEKAESTEELKNRVVENLKKRKNTHQTGDANQFILSKKQKRK